MAAGSKPAPAADAAGVRRWFCGKLTFWLPWPLLVVLDLWTKSAVFAFMGERYNELGAHLVFETAPLKLEWVTWWNPGTIWGLGQDWTAALIVIRCAAVVGLFWFAWSRPSRNRGQLLILSLILAGAIGNLYDNFTQPRNAVRDFVRCTAEWPFAWTFPAFNVADSCITVGAIGLLILLLREDLAAARAARRVSSSRGS